MLKTGDPDDPSNVSVEHMEALIIREDHHVVRKGDLFRATARVLDNDDFILYLQYAGDNTSAPHFLLGLPCTRTAVQSSPPCSSSGEVANPSSGINRYESSAASSPAGFSGS